MTDTHHLLTEYRKTGSDAAFRELVSRYVDLVYSTALRLLEGDAHRAQDVAQTVFVNLARKSRTLPEDVSLGGWLHRDTCLAAGHILRGERRRQSRERQAAEMNALQNHSDADYSHVAPLLDEAINELGEADRTAILLRFFEQHDFRAVGQALGGNEDAARMRVNRALEKLEEFLKRRGITTTAASLGVVLTANAVQAAPVGLALTISTAAALTGTTLATTATITTTKAIAMTALQKTIVTATLAVLAGVGIYEVRQASQLREQVQTLQQQQAPLAEQVHQLQNERDEATSRFAALRDENERLNRNTPELLRLRAKSAEFGRRKDESAINESDKPPKPYVNRLGQSPFVPVTKLVNAGFATPEATAQTMVWAIANKDTEGLKKVFDLEKMTAAIHEARKKLDPNFDPAAEHEHKDCLNINSLTMSKDMELAGFQILSQQFTSSDEVAVEFASSFVDGSSVTDHLNIHRVGDEWKIDILAHADPDSINFTNTVPQADGSEKTEVIKMKLKEQTDWKLFPVEEKPASP